MSILVKVFENSMNPRENLDTHKVNRKKLEINLRGAQKDLRFAWRIRLVISIVVFLILLAFVILYRNDVAKLNALMGAMGVGLIGAYRWIETTTKEMARVTLLLAITPELSEDALKELAHSTIRALSPGKR